MLDISGKNKIKGDKIKINIYIELRISSGHDTKMSHSRAIPLRQLSVTMTSWVRIWLDLRD